MANFGIFCPSILRTTRNLLILIFALWYKSIPTLQLLNFYLLFKLLLSIRPFYTWTFVNLPIRNVNHSKILLFKILALIPFDFFQNFLAILRIPFLEKKYPGDNRSTVTSISRKILERDVKSCYKNTSEIHKASFNFENSIFFFKIVKKFKYWKKIKNSLNIKKNNCTRLFIEQFFLPMC